MYPALSRWRQKGREFKVSFDYVVSLRPAWVTKDSVLHIKELFYFLLQLPIYTIMACLICQTTYGSEVTHSV